MITTVATYVENALSRYRGPMSQTEIAKATGFNSANMLSMVKAGRTRLPLARVRPFCRAIGIEPEELLLLVADEESATPESNPFWIAFGGRMPSVTEMREIARQSI